MDQATSVSASVHCKGNVSIWKSIRPELSTSIAIDIPGYKIIRNRKEKKTNHVGSGCPRGNEANHLALRYRRLPSFFSRPYFNQVTMSRGYRRKSHPAVRFVMETSPKSPEFCININRLFQAEIFVPYSKRIDGNGHEW